MKNLGCFIATVSLVLSGMSLANVPKVVSKNQAFKIRALNPVFIPAEFEFEFKSTAANDQLFSTPHPQVAVSAQSQQPTFIPTTVEINILPDNRGIRYCIDGKCRESLKPIRVDTIQQQMSGGDIVGNGGGLAEQNFVYAYLELPNYIEGLLSHIKLSEKEKQDLLLIRSSIRKHISINSNELLFLSAQDHPGLFDFTGELKLAITGWNERAPILVNRDLLYRVNAEGNWSVLDFGNMIQTLTHEFGHQVGILDHTYLDNLGAKVRRFIEGNQFKTILDIDDNIQLTAITQHMGIGRMPNIFINSKERMKSFDDDIFRTLRCQNGTFPVEVNLSNQHWSNYRIEGSELYTNFNARVRVTCLRDGVVSTERQYLQIAILYSVDKKTLSTRFWLTQE
jgi:hypothetical protein